MKPTITSLLAFILLTIGIVAVIFIIILLGKNKKTRCPNFFRWGHRLAGYTFFVLYLYICYLMSLKITSDPVTWSAKDVIHAYLGLTIFPLLVAKICIVRGFKIYYHRLPLYGMVVMIAVYLTVILSGGYFLLALARSQYIVLLQQDKPVKVNVSVGRKVVQTKCTSCHSLERVYSHLKTEDEWRDYVARMQAKDPSNLTDLEELQVLGFLVKNLGIDESKMDIQIGMKIILNKCHRCHTLERVFQQKRTKSDWIKVIEMMRSFDPQLLTDSETRQVNFYLGRILLKQEKETDS
ncbi:MAG: hypothetical protein E3K37_01730 [Candidatus Kuenenia sp.]|nr:hypothetical protein [Candidatus Kuenenia hertensis]